MNRFLIAPADIAPAAAQDLAEIWDYVAVDNLDAADRLLETLYDQILALAKTRGKDFILYRARLWLSSKENAMILR